MSSISKKTILITNDDGFRAKGIRLLAEAAREIGDVIMVAPHDARSGASAAITSAVPIDLKLQSEEEGLSIYSSTGTPVDCVKLALNTICAVKKPDLVISGINHGRNDGICVIYSGTLGAAMEAGIAGLPALAVSLDDHGANPNMDYAVPMAIRIAKMILANGLPEHTMLSLNLPRFEPRGLKVCPQTNGRFVKEYEKCINPSGHAFYWMSGYQETKEPGVAGDHEYLEEGFATLTPIHTNMTKYDYLDHLERQIETGELF